MRMSVQIKPTPDWQERRVSEIYALTFDPREHGGMT